MPRSRSHETALVAALSRSRAQDDPDLVQARRALNLRRAEDHLALFLTAVPPPTSEERRRLAARLVAADEGVAPA